MSHYDIDYSKLTGDAKRDKALRDIADYCGALQYQKVMQFVRDSLAKGLTEEFIRMGCSFAGIQGYPVMAMIEYCKEFCL